MGVNIGAFLPPSDYCSCCHDSITSPVWYGSSSRGRFALPSPSPLFLPLPTTLSPTQWLRSIDWHAARLGTGQGRPKRPLHQQIGMVHSLHYPTSSRLLHNEPTVSANCLLNLKPECAERPDGPLSSHASSLPEVICSVHHWQASWGTPPESSCC